MKIQALLEKHNVKLINVGQETRANCIFCDDTKAHMYINTVKDVFFCHKCQTAGNVWKIAKHYGMDIKPLLTEKKDLWKDLKDKDKVLINNLITRNDEKALRYLMSERGFSKDSINKFKLGVDGEWIAFPYYQQGRLVNIKYRNINFKEFRREEGCPSTLFNIDSIDKTKDIIVVEGECDCIAAVQLGYENTVSVSIGANAIDPSYLDFFDSTIGNIYLVFDNDEKGNSGADNLAKKIGIERCYRVRLPLKDFNDCLMSGLTKNELDQCFIDSETFKPKHLYSVCDIFSDVDDIYDRRNERIGTLTDWTEFDIHLGGLRMPEVTVITGETGSGKTTFVLNIIYKLICNRKKVLIVSSEIPAGKILVKLCTMYNKKLFYHQQRDEYSNAVNYFSDKQIYFVKVLGKLTSDQLREYIIYCKRKYDIEFIMLDHLHFFIDWKRDNMSQDIEVFMKDVVCLSHETNTHLFLIAHPSKLNNTAGKVNMNDLKGSSSIKQDSSNIITITRVKQKEQKTENIVLVEFQKVRDENGKTGLITFEFDANSLLYTEAEIDIRNEQTEMQAM